MKWTNVDFVFQRFQIGLSSLLYLISFIISVYLYFEIQTKCNNTFFFASMLTSIAAYIVPLYVYGCLKPEANRNEDTLTTYKFGKLVHVIVAVLATLYNALALAETIHLKDICSSYKDTDTNNLLTLSIINTITYNGVTFLGHSMMRKPPKDMPMAVKEKIEEKQLLRSDLQRRNSVRF